MMRFFRPTTKISVQDSQTRRQQQRQELLQHNAEQRKRAAKKEEARLRLQQQQQRQQQQREHLYQQQQQQQQQRQQRSRHSRTPVITPTQRRQGEEMRQRQLQLMRNRRERQPRMLQYREQTLHENTEMQGLGLESGLQADRAAIARMQRQRQQRQREHLYQQRNRHARGDNSTAAAALRRRQSELIRHQRQRRIQRELDQQQRQPGRQLSLSSSSDNVEGLQKRRERIAQSLIFLLSDSRIASSTKPELSAPVVESFSEKNDDVDQSFDPLLLTDCSVCLEDYQSGELLCATKVTACPHVFHYHCINDWLKEHDDCPLCRTNLL